MIFEAELPDIPRLYTAFAEWFACIICVFPFIKKWNYNKAVVIVASLFGQILLQLLVSQFPLMMWIPGMMINIGWMFFVVWFLSRVNLKMNTLLTVKAFIISELLASLAWQLYVMLIWKSHFDRLMIEVIVAALLFFIVGLIIYYIDLRINYQRLINAVTEKAVLIFVLTAIIIFAVSNVGFILSQTDFHLGNAYSVFFVRTIVNISGISLMYLQQYQMIDYHRRRELDNVQNLFHSQYQQYKAYAENTYYINRKAHDLKHQIDVILAESNLDTRQQYLSKLRDAIDNLGTKIETGNGVLDTILTRKNAYCQENKINFTCIANGALLHNMDIMDLCSLFGNALDNAIEHVEKIADPEKRLITLKLQNKGKMLVLRVDNYCIEPSMDLSQLPKTTKNNKENHGYGLKNIAYIAKKYKGNMTVEIEDHWFSLCVVFPIV